MLLNIQKTMKDQKMEDKKITWGKHRLALDYVMDLSEWVLDDTNQPAFWNLFFTPSLGNGKVNENFVENHFYSK